MSTIEAPNLLTAAQLAEVLGVHVNRIYEMSGRNEIPSLKVGGVRRFMWDEVLSALRARS